MKKCMYFASFLVAFILIVFVGLPAYAAGNPEQTPAGCQSSGSLTTTVVVDNVSDLIKNIKSNTTIKLKPGDYNLDTAAASSNPNVWYEMSGLFGSYYEATGPIFSGITNLQIVCDSTDNVFLYITSPTDNVLILNNCVGVTFNNITLGHKIPVNNVCSAGVVYLCGCTNAVFNQCNVYGCGTVGFTVDGSSNVRINSSWIHNCLHGASLFLMSDDVQFTDTTVSYNGNTSHMYLFYSEQSNQISLSGCSILNNGNTENPSDPMFYSDTHNCFTLLDCTVSNNRYSRLGLSCAVVSFQPQGGSYVKNKATGIGTLLTPPTPPTRTGYVFFGWYKDSACTKPWNFATDKVTSNITLYAKWVSTVPSGVKAASASYNSITISWNAVPNAKGYEIFRVIDKAGNTVSVGTSATTAFTATGLTTGKLYYYIVKSYTWKGTQKIYSNSSATVSATPIPATPASVKAVNAGAASITVSWGAVAGATQYEVWRSSTATGTFVLAQTTASLSFTNTDLTTGKTYYYKVLAYHLEGTVKVYSLPSAVVFAKA